MKGFHQGGGDDVDRGAESECSTTSTQQSSIGRPYTPSLLDDASDADVDSLRKNSMDSDVHSKDVEGVPARDARVECASRAGGVYFNGTDAIYTKFQSQATGLFLFGDCYCI
jgi:hypothetical protein